MVNTCCTHSNPEQVLKVTVVGGGPVGLTLALLLESVLHRRVAIRVYKSRWIQDGARVVWKTEAQGNVRRQQVVTIQSRHFLKFPQEVQDRLFQDGHYSEMWPQGPDSVNGHGPRNVRIAHVEEELLDIANDGTDHADSGTF